MALALRLLFFCFCFIILRPSFLFAGDIPKSGENQEPCEMLEMDIKSIWNEEIKRKAASVFAKLNRSYSGKILSEITTAMDEITQGWVTLGKRICKEYFIDKSITEKEYSLKQSCYDSELMEIHFFSAMLQHADERLAQNAYRIYLKISEDIRSCQKEDVYAAFDQDLGVENKGALQLAKMYIVQTELELIAGYNKLASQTANKAFLEAQKSGSKKQLADALIAKGKVSFEYAKYADAASKFQEAITVYQGLRDKAGLANGLTGLARVKDELGEHAKALELYDRAMDINTEIFGAKSKKAADLLKFKADTLVLLADFKQALSVLENSLRIHEESHGLYHPATAKSYESIGAYWDQVGKPEKAIEFYKKSNDILSFLYGENHPQIAGNLENSARSSYKLGNYGQSLTKYRKSLGIYQKINGPDSINVANCLSNIGKVYLAKNQYAKALENFEKILAIYRRINGPEHQTTAYVLNLLGDALTEMNESERAIENYEKSLRIYLKHKGEMSIEVNNCYYDLAYSWRKLGELKKALDLNNKSLAICEKIFGKDHLTTSGTLMQIGYTLTDLDRCREALPYFERALKIIERKLGQEDQRTKHAKKWVDFCNDKL